MKDYHILNPETFSFVFMEEEVQIWILHKEVCKFESLMCYAMVWYDMLMRFGDLYSILPKECMSWFRSNHRVLGVLCIFCHHPLVQN